MGVDARSIISVRHIVLQPTSACNLNCAYCYLPDRNKRNEMPLEVASAVARSIQELPGNIRVMWHGGEPLACGVDKFRSLITPFSALKSAGKVQHSLQTNATLIDQVWCDFLRSEGFKIGVSLDGPKEFNDQRIRWNGRDSFDSAISGISLLIKNRMPFGVIAVVNENNIKVPRDIYNFFVSLLSPLHHDGSLWLGINVEEKEGANQRPTRLSQADVKLFWKELFRAWVENPKLVIREFNNALGWMKSVADCGQEVTPGQGDLWPTIAYNGDVVVLSPEFMSVEVSERSRFIVGNILKTPLAEILKNAAEAEYFKKFLAGKDLCRQTCSYYSYCGGGQPSNKYFENGRVDTTETNFCRNTRQAVVDAVLESLVETQNRRIGG